MSQYTKQDENLPFDLAQAVLTTCAGSGREITFQGSAEDPAAWRWFVGDEEAQFDAYRATGGKFRTVEAAGF